MHLFFIHCALRGLDIIVCRLLWNVSIPLLLIVPTPAFLPIHPIIPSLAPILSLFHPLSLYSISYINSIASFPPFSPLYHSHPMLLLELLLMVLPLALLIFTLSRNPFLLHSFSTIWAMLTWKTPSPLSNILLPCFFLLTVLILSSLTTLMVTSLWVFSGITSILSSNRLPLLTLLPSSNTLTFPTLPLLF